MSIVVFNLAGFRARYPEFSTVPDATIEAYWSEATIYLNNTNCSVVTCINIRAVLLNMLTAHIAALYSGTNGNPPTGAVGRVSSATQGSVSAGLDMGPTTNNQAWFLQTQYGASYWQATAPYRQARYIPGRSRPAPRTVTTQGFPDLDGM